MADESPSDPNRRAFVRAAIRQPATVAYVDHALAVQTLDLGRGGLSFVSPRPIAPGTRCTLAFDAPLGDEPAGLAAGLKVVYSSYLAPEQFKIGAVFVAPEHETARALLRYAASLSSQG